jgi:hypothetical protein
MYIIAAPARLRGWRVVRPRCLLPILVVLGLVVSASTAAAASAQQFAGVNTHVLDTFSDGYSQLRLLWVAELLQNVRAGVPKDVRIDLRWNQLEPFKQGQYSSTYVSEIDQVVSWANGYGLKPLFTVLGTPCWASSAPPSVKNGCTDPSAGDAYPPSKPSYYAQAMKWLAQRYGTNVAGWELWNEPNQPFFWSTSDPAGAYVSLVKATYPAIKSVSTVPVVAGALSLSDTTFTSELYADGIKGKFDIFSIHPYSFQCSPLDVTGPCVSYFGPQASFIAGVPAVRNVMLKSGDTSPLWLTEFGWTTSTTSGGVSPSTQATYVDQAYTQIPNWSSAVGSNVNVQGAFYYDLQDDGSDTSNDQDNYGLVYYNGTDKPAASVFITDAARLY